MDHRVYEKEYLEARHFFFSELKIDNEDLCYLVELMRAASHIKELQELMILLGGDEEIISEEHLVERDSVIILLFNIFVAQMREALKLLAEVTEREYFKQIKQKFSIEENERYEYLIEVFAGHNKEGTFMHDTVIPLRNLIFHYEAKKARLWIDDIKEQEKSRKPHYQSVNLNDLEFGPGVEYDQHIFSKHLVWGKDPPALMNNLKKIFHMQDAYLRTVKTIVEKFLDVEGIKQRKLDWFLKYAHGFKTDI